MWAAVDLSAWELDATCLVHFFLPKWKRQQLIKECFWLVDKRFSAELRESSFFIIGQWNQGKEMSISICSVALSWSMVVAWKYSSREAQSVVAMNNVLPWATRQDVCADWLASGCYEHRLALGSKARRLCTDWLVLLYTDTSVCIFPRDLGQMEWDWEHYYIKYNMKKYGVESYNCIMYNYRCDIRLDTERKK